MKRRGFIATIIGLFCGGAAKGATVEPERDYTWIANEKVYLGEPEPKKGLIVIHNGDAEKGIPSVGPIKTGATMMATWIDGHFYITHAEV